MAVVSLAAAAALVGMGNASADYFGGNSATEQRQMKALIRERFGHGKLGDTMICIAGRESGFNPRAMNWVERATGRGYYGLFQVGSRHATIPGNAAYRLTGGDPTRLFDPEINVQVAWIILRRHGLAAWPVDC